MRTRLHATFLVGLLLPAAACSRKESPTAASSSASTAAPAASGAGPSNTTLVDHVKAHAEGCTVNVEQGQAYGCKSGITDALAKYVRENKPADFASTLLTLIAKKDDPKTSATALALFNEQFDNLGEDGKRKNASAQVASAGLALLKESTGNRAARLAPPMTQIATLSDALESLYAVADTHQTKEARDNVYRNLLVFGRLKTLPKLKEVAAKPEHTSAALDAVPRMFKPTGAELALVCPWAKGYLSNRSLTIATEAAQDMIFCRGEFIDALVGEAEARLKSKEFKEPFAQVMREPCFEFITNVTTKAAVEKQCDDVFAFLEKVVNDASVEDATRGMALYNIYYQRRDDKTLKLMRKYEKHPNKEVAKRAKEAIVSLTTTYKLKG